MSCAAPEHARQQLELRPGDAHARLLELGHRRAQARAGRDLELGGRLLHRHRRHRVPDGVDQIAGAREPAATTRAKRVLRMQRKRIKFAPFYCGHVPRIAKLDQYGLAAGGGRGRARVPARAVDQRHREPRRPVGARSPAGARRKGRLLATFLVVPSPDGFLLQLARDLVPAVAKRLSMFVLRSKVKITDVIAASGHNTGSGALARQTPLDGDMREGTVGTVRRRCETVSCVLGPQLGHRPKPGRRTTGRSTKSAPAGR